MRPLMRICTLVKHRGFADAGRYATELLPRRAAALHATQAYDQFLAPTGQRMTQFSILVKLKLNDLL
jgi:hypothetical protein